MPALTGLWLLLNPTLFGEPAVQLFHVFAWGTVTRSCGSRARAPAPRRGLGAARAVGADVRRLATIGYGVYLVHIPLLDHVIVPAARALDARHVSMILIWPAALTTLMTLSFRDRLRDARPHREALPQDPPAPRELGTRIELRIEGLAEADLGELDDGEAVRAPRRSRRTAARRDRCRTRRAPSGGRPGRPRGR